MNKRERELDIKEIVLYLWQHIAALAICMLAGALCAVLITQRKAKNVLPYQASALFYLDTKSGTDGARADLGEQLEFYTNITNLSSVVLRSSQVLDAVSDNLGLDMDGAQLANFVSVESVGSSSFMRLVVRDSDPERAERICNEILAVAPDASANMTNLGTLQAVSTAEITEAGKPSLTKAGVVGALLGFVLGVLVLVGIELFDHVIRDAGDVEYYLGAKTLGVLPIENQKNKADESKEAYRSLCVNLESALPTGICPVVLVAGISAKDSVAQAAEKMAKSFAEAGKKTLLIDADVHCGQVSTHLGMTGAAGLVELLHKEASSDTVLVYNESLESTVLSCGNCEKVSAQDLSLTQFAPMLESLRKQFDIILIAAASVTMATDAAALSHLANGIVMVASVGKTTIESALLAKEKMELVNAPVCGIVLNEYNYRKARRRDGYYYAFSASRR